MRRSLILLAAGIAMLVAAGPAGAFRLGGAPRPVTDNPADHLVDIAPDPEVYTRPRTARASPGRA
jgi:hypothetical protein